ncbi:MAG: class I SAM-dependent methyltransferase [Candidatus Andersenbacteria bacterium]
MANAAAPYTGTDTLEVLQDAVRYNRFLVDQVCATVGSKHRVLDVGAGIGTFAAAVRDAGHDVTCLVTDHDQADRLRADGFTCIEDAQQLPATSYDGAYSLNVLEHVVDDVGLLRQVHRALRPGAQVYLYVPAFPVLYTSLDRKVGHVRRYRLAELVTKARAAGFRVTRAGYVDALGFAAALMYRAVGVRDGRLSPPMVKLYDRVLFPTSRALDRLTSGWFGKNLAVVAVKG